MDINQKIDFIEEIKNHPELYDKDNPHFHDYNKKNEIWNLVGEKFNIAEPKTKWSTLRDKFVRLKRIRATGSPSEYDHYPEHKWNLYDHLSFLNNFCRHRKRPYSDNQSKSTLKSNNTESLEVQTRYPKKRKVNSIKTINLPTKTEYFEFTNISFNDEDDNSKFNNHEVESETHSYSVTSYSDESRTNESVKKELLENINKSSGDFVNTTKTTSTNNSKLDNDENENILFIKMIGKKLDLLPSKKRNKIQIQILELVNKELDKCNF